MVRIVVSLRNGMTLEYHPGRPPVVPDDENGVRAAIKQLREGFALTHNWLLDLLPLPVREQDKCGNPEDCTCRHGCDIP